MAFLGNRTGPRLSQVLQTLGPSALGLSPDQWEEAVEAALRNEADGLVDPVHVDEGGRLYIEFLADRGRRLRVDLARCGRLPSGDILTFTPQEAQWWTQAHTRSC